MASSSALGDGIGSSGTTLGPPRATSLGFDDFYTEKAAPHSVDFDSKDRTDIPKAGFGDSSAMPNPCGPTMADQPADHAQPEYPPLPPGYYYHDPSVPPANLSELVEAARNMGPSVGPRRVYIPTVKKKPAAALKKKPSSGSKVSSKTK